MPCADAQINIENGKASMYATRNATSDKHFGDNCSPFCICNCCHTNVFYRTLDSVENNVVTLFTEKKTIEYNSTLFSDFHNSIWQPPQIS
jgi:hypothetical protein